MDAYSTQVRNRCACSRRHNRTNGREAAATIAWAVAMALAGAPTVVRAQDGADGADSFVSGNGTVTAGGGAGGATDSRALAA